MKKLRIWLIAVAVAVSLLALFFLEVFKPMVAQSIDRLARRPVRVRNISLSWKNGPAVRLDQVWVYSRDKKEIQFQFDRIQAVLRPESLLALRPRFSSLLVTNKSGYLQRSASGRLCFLKNPSRSAHLVAVKDLTVVLRSAQAQKPYLLTARLGLSSASENLAVSGRWVPAEANVLYDAQIDGDFKPADVSGLSLLLPELEALDLRQLSGKFSVNAARFTTSLCRSWERPFDFRLSQAVLTAGVLPQPAKDLSVELTADGGDIGSWFITGELADGARVEAEGRSSLIEDVWHTQLVVNAVNWKLDQPITRENRLKGTVAFSFEGEFRGVSRDEIVGTLAGKGDLSITGGTVTRINVLKEIFLALTPSDPVLGIAAEDTAFDLWESTFELGSEQAVSDDFRLEGPGFQMEARLAWGPDNLVEGEAMVRTEDGQEFPAALENDGQALRLLPR